MSGGCPVSARWVPGECPVSVRWVSGGCPQGGQGRSGWDLVLGERGRPRDRVAPDTAGSALVPVSPLSPQRAGPSRVPVSPACSATSDLWDSPVPVSPVPFATPGCRDSPYPISLVPLRGAGTARVTRSPTSSVAPGCRAAPSPNPLHRWEWGQPLSPCPLCHPGAQGHPMSPGYIPCPLCPATSGEGTAGTVPEQDGDPAPSRLAGLSVSSGARGGVQGGDDHPPVGRGHGGRPTAATALGGRGARSQRSPPAAQPGSERRPAGRGAGGPACQACGADTHFLLFQLREQWQRHSLWRAPTSRTARTSSRPSTRTAPCTSAPRTVSPRWG